MDNFEIGICIRADSLVPEEVTEWLGVRPTAAFAKGEEYESRAGATMARPWGVWRFALAESSEELRPQELVATFYESIHGWLDRLQKYRGVEGTRVTLYIHWKPEGGSGGYTLGSSELSMLVMSTDEVDFYFS